MSKDTITVEVRKHRKDILDSYNGDWKAMMRDAMKRQHQSGHEVVEPKVKVIPPGSAPNAYALRKPGK